MKSVIEADGVRWPVTGTWCSACGMPLHPANAPADVHPCCEPQSNCNQSRKETEC